jgi:hypothetical protein
MQAGWLDVRFVDRLRVGDADGAFRLTRGWEAEALRRLAAVVGDAALPDLARETAAQLLPAVASEAGCPAEALCAELDRLADGAGGDAAALAARLTVARLELTPRDAVAAVLASAVARAGGAEELDTALRGLPPSPASLRARLRLGGSAAATNALAALAEAPPSDLAVALAAIVVACPVLDGGAVAPIEALLASLPAWDGEPDDGGDADRDGEPDSAGDADRVGEPDSAGDADRVGEPDSAVGATGGLLPLPLAEAALAFRLLGRAAAPERIAEVVAMAPPALAPLLFAAVRGEAQGPAIAVLVAADPRCGDQLRQAAVAR